MNPTIKLIAAFAVGLAIPAMAASEPAWHAAHAAKPKSCATIVKGPLAAAYTVLAESRKAAEVCATD